MLLFWYFGKRTESVLNLSVGTGFLTFFSCFGFHRLWKSWLRNSTKEETRCSFPSSPIGVLTVRFPTLFHDHWCVCCLKASCHSALEAGLAWASGTVRQDCSVQRARGSWLAGSSSSMLDVAHFQSSHAEAFMGPCTAHCWVPSNSTLSEPKAPIHSSIKFHCALLAQ